MEIHDPGLGHAVAEADHWLRVLLQQSDSFQQLGAERDLFVVKLLPDVLMNPESEGAVLSYGLMLCGFRREKLENAELLSALLKSATLDWYVDWSIQAWASFSKSLAKPVDVAAIPDLISAGLVAGSLHIADAELIVDEVILNFEVGSERPLAPFYRRLRGICGGLAPPEEEERTYGPIVSSLYAQVVLELRGSRDRRFELESGTDFRKRYGFSGRLWPRGAIADDHRLAKRLKSGIGFLGIGQPKHRLSDLIRTTSAGDVARWIKQPEGANAVSALTVVIANCAGEMCMEFFAEPLRTPFASADPRAKAILDQFNDERLRFSKQVDPDLLAFELMAFACFALRNATLDAISDGSLENLNASSVEELFDNAVEAMADAMDGACGWNTTEVLVGRLRCYGASSSLDARADNTSAVSFLATVIHDCVGQRVPQHRYKRTAALKLHVSSRAEGLGRIAVGRLPILNRLFATYLA
jgi:hypothetical protein